MNKSEVKSVPISQALPFSTAVVKVMMVSLMKEPWSNKKDEDGSHGYRDGWS